MNAHLQQPAAARLQRFLLAFAGLVALVFLVLSYLERSLSFAIAGDLAMLFFATYLTYAVTKDLSEKAAGEALQRQQESARDDLRQLATASGRRIFLLAEHIRNLAQEALEVNVRDKADQIRFLSFASELTRLASHAELSVQDLHPMGTLDISISALKEEARTQVIEATRREQVACPLCEVDNEVLFGLTPGACKHATCSHCRGVFVLHRLPDQSIRVAADTTTVIDCPNPECHSDIRIRSQGHEYGTVIRACHDCFARIHFNIDTRQVESWNVEEPLALPVARIIDTRGQCPYCADYVTFNERRNRNEQWVQFCPNCTRLIRVDESTGGA